MSPHCHYSLSLQVHLLFDFVPTMTHTTLSPSATIHALYERASVVLLKLIVASSNVSPLLVLLAKNTSQFPVFLSHETTYTLSPDAAILVFSSESIRGSTPGIVISLVSCGR